MIFISHLNPWSWSDVAFKWKQQQPQQEKIGLKEVL